MLLGVYTECYLVFLIEASFVTTPHWVHLFLFGKNWAAAVTRYAQLALVELSSVLLIDDTFKGRSPLGGLSDRSFVL